MGHCCINRLTGGMKAYINFWVALALPLISVRVREWSIDLGYELGGREKMRPAESEFIEHPHPNLINTCSYCQLLYSR